METRVNGKEVLVVQVIDQIGNILSALGGGGADGAPQLVTATEAGTLTFLQNAQNRTMSISAASNLTAQTVALPADGVSVPGQLVRLYSASRSIGAIAYTGGVVSGAPTGITAGQTLTIQKFANAVVSPATPAQWVCISTT